MVWTVCDHRDSPRRAERSRNISHVLGRRLAVRGLRSVDGVKRRAARGDSVIWRSGDCSIPLWGSGCFNRQVAGIGTCSLLKLAACSTSLSPEQLRRGRLQRCGAYAEAQIGPRHRDNLTPLVERR